MSAILVQSCAGRVKQIRSAWITNQRRRKNSLRAKADLWLKCPVSSSDRFKKFFRYKLVQLDVYRHTLNVVRKCTSGGWAASNDKGIWGAKLKEHITSEPDIKVESIDDDTEFIILASDGLWKVRSAALVSSNHFDCIETILQKTKQNQKKKKTY